MSKYKAGDLVEICKFPPEDRKLNPSWTSRMDQYCGKICTIKDISSYGWLSLEDKETKRLQ